MEENLDKLFDYRPLIPGSGRFASIVGIGGGAGRVVDQMRKCCLPDVQLYAFGMNRKEMDELSLCGKYLIGQEGLGSGKDRFLAEYECSKSFPAIESVLRGRLVAVFVVCLGGGTGEGCIRTFLQFPTPSKHIDFFMLAGNLDFLRKEVKDLWKKLPAKYSSADEVAMAVFSIENADWSDDKETTEAMDVVHECFLQLPPDAEGKWGIYPDETLPPHQFRLRVFTKCKR